MGDLTVSHLALDGNAQENGLEVMSGAANGNYGGAVSLPQAGFDIAYTGSEIGCICRCFCSTRIGSRSIRSPRETGTETAFPSRSAI